MAIGPLGSTIYTNQNTAAAAMKQAAAQSRVEMQNLMASAIANEKNKIVKELRPTEEAHKIDAEKEHQRQRSEEEMGAKGEEITRDTKNKRLKKNEEENPTTRRLDITA